MAWMARWIDAKKKIKQQAMAGAGKINPGISYYRAYAGLRG